MSERILVVDDEPDLLELVRLNLSQAGFEVDTAAVAEGEVVTLRVADSGIGISPDDQQRIFERFYRVDASRSRALGGTGLGLSIVKHLVHSMGGTIDVESRLGSGSTFTVRLPRADRTV